MMVKSRSASETYENFNFRRERFGRRRFDSDFEGERSRNLSTLRKTPKSADEIQWDAEKGFSESEQAKLENFDAVFHLAGDNVAEGKLVG